MNHSGARFRDLTDPRLMALKAGLFVLAFALCGVVVAVMHIRGDRAGLWWSVGAYLLGGWCLSRSYYFAFYVITAYCDPRFRYSGVWSAVRWVMCRGDGES